MKFARHTFHTDLPFINIKRYTQETVKPNIVIWDGASKSAKRIEVSVPMILAVIKQKEKRS